MPSSPTKNSISSSVAILTGPQTHLDHLGVLSALLNIPLIVTEESHLQSAQKFYPELNVELKSMDELSLGYMAHNYDVIFETGKFFATELKPLFELLFQKKMRFVFCPHGNSNKGHSLTEHVQQDISLVYGEHLYDLLKNTGASEKIHHFVRTGNYRYPYYRHHQQFFDALAEKEVFSKFQEDKPIILYAPTWSDQENVSSFFSAIDRIICDLSPSYNLLIKLHPFLYEDSPAHLVQIQTRYEHHPSVLFLTDFPPIYPLLARCSIYLGDYSSIGYDFLAFDKPLYFFSSGDSPLQTCGLTIPDKKNINDFLEATLGDCQPQFSEQRKKTYNYAFGKEVDPTTIINEIFNLTSKTTNVN